MNSRRRSLAPLVAGIAAFALCSCSPPAESPLDETAYRQAIQEHRSGREARLQAEDGWLSLVGLHWLQSGENRFGSDPDNAIVLPSDAAPGVAGSLYYEAPHVRLVCDPAVGVTIDGETLGQRTLQDDSAGSPDIVRLGRLQFYVLFRDGRHAVRIKDPEASTRREFHGIDYYPVDPSYRVRARLELAEPPEEVAVPTVLGTATQMYGLGHLRFEMGGQAHSLLALVGQLDDPDMFLIFRDATSGGETYGAGRYLYATREADDTAWVDFNKAYNPPCAFTPFATCPMPPRGNRLSAAILAGEKAYAGGH